MQPRLRRSLHTISCTLAQRYNHHRRSPPDDQHRVARHAEPGLAQRDSVSAVAMKLLGGLCYVEIQSTSRRTTTWTGKLSRTPNNYHVE